MPQKLDTTLKAFEGDIKKMDPADAVKNIEGWMTALEKADWRGAKTIHDNLSKLKNKLSSEKLDSAEVTKLLNLLGEETGRAAAHAGEAKGEKLTQLGELLANLGTTKAKK